MIVEIENYNILSGLHDVNIIYNPVPLTRTVDNRLIFDKNIARDYKIAYNKYIEYTTNSIPEEILGDIQLLYDSGMFILNSYVYEFRKLNKLFFVKTLVELFNLSEKYKLNIAIPIDMNIHNKKELQDIKLIINEVFGDYKYTVYLFKTRIY